MARKIYKKLGSCHFSDQNPFLLLRSSLAILLQNPVVLFPTAVLALIQLLTIEILYFAPQYPLSVFFAPLIRRVWSEEYLHYPLNLVLLPKMFYYAQMLIYLFIGSFLLALTTKVILVLNEHPVVNMREAIKETLGRYVHIFLAAVLSFIIFQILANGYVAVLDSFIRHKPLGQTTFFWNRMLLWTIPYVHFFVGILSTVLVTYIIPIIIIDKKKVYTAFLMNLKILWRSFPLTFFFVLIPTMLYLPLLTARNNISALMNVFGPEVQIAVIILGLVISMSIDLLILVSSTILFLFLRENP